MSKYKVIRKVTPFFDEEEVRREIFRALFESDDAKRLNQEALERVQKTSERLKEWAEWIAQQDNER